MRVWAWATSSCATASAAACWCTWWTAPGGQAAGLQVPVIVLVLGVQPAVCRVPKQPPSTRFCLPSIPALLFSLPMRSPDPMGDYRAIRQELELFNPLLATKPQVGHTGSLATVLQGLLQLLPHVSA